MSAETTRQFAKLDQDMSAIMEQIRQVLNQSRQLIPLISAAMENGTLESTRDKDIARGMLFFARTVLLLGEMAGAIDTMEFVTNHFKRGIQIPGEAA